MNNNVVNKTEKNTPISGLFSYGNVMICLNVACLVPKPNLLSRGFAVKEPLLMSE